MEKTSVTPSVEAQVKRWVFTYINNFEHVNGGWSAGSLEYVMNGNATVLAPPFGYAPFLRVDYVLRTIFERTLGYRLDFGNRAYNPLEHICMLHGCADAVVDNKLRLKQLVADCTVEDFVQSIENMFCGKFILDAKANVVRWVLWNDVLRGAYPAREPGWVYRPDVAAGGAPKPYGAELRPYLEGYPEVSMQERRAIKLTMQRNMGSDGKKTYFKVATPEEFYGDAVAQEYPPDTSESFGTGGKRDAARIGALLNNGSWLCCNTFNYFNAADGDASVDMPIAAEHLPTLPLPGHVPAYGFGLSFFNSAPPAKEDGSEGSDKESKRPLAFAVYFFDPFAEGSVCKGTTIGVPVEGRPDESAQPLRLHLPDGLFSSYHYLRDKLLRQGVYSLTVTLDSSVSVSENELYLFDGQPVMVESVLETLGAATQVVKLQTIKIADESS